MKACEDRLAALVAPEELDARGREELEAHLAACAGCRAELAELHETEELLRAESFEPDPISALRFTTQATNRAEARRDRSLAGMWWFLTRPQRWAAAFSAAALTASVAFFVAGQAPAAAPEAAPVAVAHAQPAADDFDDEGWSAGLPTIAATSDAAEALAALEDDDGEMTLDDAFADLSDDEIQALSTELEQDWGAAG